MLMFFQLRKNHTNDVEVFEIIILKKFYKYLVHHHSIKKLKDFVNFFTGQ